MKDSVIFSIFTVLYNHIPYLVSVCAGAYALILLIMKLKCREIVTFLRPHKKV